MDLLALQQLNLETVNQALALWAQIQQAQADLTRLEDRIANAAATVQAFNSNTQSIAQLAKSDLKTLVKMGKAFLLASAPVQGVLVVVNGTIQQIVQAVDDALTAGANLQAQAVKNLADVMTLYKRLENFQKNGGEVDFAKKTFVAYANQWLNHDFVFTVNQEPLTVHFTTALGSIFPFGTNANLSAKLVYQALTATIEGIALEFDAGTGTAVPDFTHARVSPNFNPSQFVGAIATQLSSELPAGLTVKNPKLDTLSNPPVLTVDAKFAGLPAFNTLSCEATLGISPKKVVFVNVSGGIDTLLVPIPPGTLAIKGFGFKFQKEPILGLSGPSLKVATSIVPTADGGTGATIALDLKNDPAGIYFPTDKLGREFAFKGNLRLLSTVTCGIVNGHFNLNPPEFDLHLEMPSSQFPKTPFGGGDIFELKADAKVDSSGIHFNGDATYVRFIHGTVKGDISFSGSGTVTATVAAQAFGARATFSADWKPGFSSLVIDVSVSVELSINGFARLTASAEVRCTVTNESATGHITAKILGIPIDQDFTISNDLAATLESLLVPRNNDIVKLVFEKGEQLLKELDPTKKNGFLRRAFASLDPFKLVPAAVPAAKEMFEQADKAINDTKKAVENAGGQAAKGFKSIVKKGKKIVPGVGLQGDPFSLADPFFPFPTILENNFLKEIDEVLSKLNKFGVADKLADRLASAFVNKELPHDGNEKEPVDSRLDVSFDQIVVGADDMNGTQQTAKAYFVGFFLVGGSSTRRRGQQITGGLAQWGCVKFVDDPTHGLLASILVAIGEEKQKVLKNDASILNAMHKIYAKIKAILLEIDPNQRFGDATNPNADPNDPGPEPASAPAFDQPPLGNLPIIEDDDMPAFILTLLQTSQWRGQYLRHLTGEVRRTLIHFQGDRASYQVFEGNQHLTDGSMTGVTYSKTGGLYTIHGTFHELGVSGPFDFVVNPVTGKFDGDWSTIGPPPEDGTWQGESTPVSFS